MAKVEVPNPETVKDADLTIPATFGRDTPPVAVLESEVDNTTVPKVVLTASLPKLISTVFAMVSGVMISADPVAVADTCPGTTCAFNVDVNPDTKTMAAKNAIKFFTTLSFFMF